MVMDEAGNAYIASFYKGNLMKDEIYVCKVDTSGNVLWELGAGMMGRATAITIDENEHIWVCGFYYNQLFFEEKRLPKNS